MIMALQKSEKDQNYKHDLIKASDKLGKVRGEAEIRQLINGLMQKTGANLYVSLVTLTCDLWCLFFFLLLIDFLKNL